MHRKQIVQRQQPVHTQINKESPFTVGNGEFAFTADITGLQTLSPCYEAAGVPLCTMSQWGWHSTPVSETKKVYTTQELEMTTYISKEKTVQYAVDCKEGNAQVYHWLRENPHRFHLGRIGLLLDGKEIEANQITDICQTLHLYEGILSSSFRLNGVACKVTTVCHQEKNCVAFRVETPLLMTGLQIAFLFPYGSSTISGADWQKENVHKTIFHAQRDAGFILERRMDDTTYWVNVSSDQSIYATQKAHHAIWMQADTTVCTFTVSFGKENMEAPSFAQVYGSSIKKWSRFWENVGIIDFSRCTDLRGLELERRMIRSLYLLAIQSSGHLPPQETGLTCNSWYGKFHLEMHPWHSLFMPLWHCSTMLEKSLGWYEAILEKAKENAQKNGYKGARWPKMVAFDGEDSPSPIATLLVWQQPHLIYLLAFLVSQKKETVCGDNTGSEELQWIGKYWHLIKETADFMCDFVVWNEERKCYDLVAPLIPAQEEHKPMETINPTFELAYWRCTLILAAQWAEALGEPQPLWSQVAEHMAPLPIRDGLYLAHENCPETFTKYNRDHPSMLLALGFLPGVGVDKAVMRNTLKKVIEVWDFSTMWGWDFALMAMTAFRLGEPQWALDLLLQDTPKNQYVVSGNNYQRLRKDLPVYLPGNGSLLLCMALLFRGTQTEPTAPLCGAIVEGVSPFPF